MYFAQVYLSTFTNWNSLILPVSVVGSSEAITMMQVGDVTKNSHSISKTYTSMTPLTWILKIYALNANVGPKRSQTYVFAKTFCTYSLLAVLSLYCLYYKVTHVYNSLDVSIRLTDTIQIISDVCQYAVDLYFVHKYGRNICEEYFKQYDKIDNFLDTSCYAVLKRKLIKFIIFYVTIWALSSFGDLGAWFVTFGSLIPVIHGISYVFLFIKMLTTLDLIAHVMHAEARLRMISNFVQKCYSCTEVCPVGQLTDCVRNKNWLYRDEEGAIPHTTKERTIDSFEIKRISKCYLLLTEQVMFVNKMYGVRMISNIEFLTNRRHPCASCNSCINETLLNTWNLLLDMVKVLNTTIRIAVGSQRIVYHGGNYNYLPGITGLMRFLTCASILISMVYQCEQTYQQREQVMNVIDHLIINKNPGEDLRTEIVELRTLLQNRPISFKMENFVTLNYPLLVSIASVVVTYTIILLQNLD